VYSFISQHSLPGKELTAHTLRKLIAGKLIGKPGGLIVGNRSIYPLRNQFKKQHRLSNPFNKSQ
jgi:hypothetical protein